MEYKPEAAVDAASDAAYDLFDLLKAAAKYAELLHQDLNVFRDANLKAFASLVTNLDNAKRQFEIVKTRIENL